MFDALKHARAQDRITLKEEIWANPGHNGKTTCMFPPPKANEGDLVAPGGESGYEGSLMYTHYTNAPGPPMPEF